MTGSDWCFENAALELPREAHSGGGQVKVAAPAMEGDSGYVVHELAVVVVKVECNVFDRLLAMGRGSYLELALRASCWSKILPFLAHQG